MREAKMFLPRNGDMDVHIAQVIRHVNAAFGGCSVMTGSGYWVSPKDGKTFAEEICSVEIAYEQTAENDHKLYDIANAFRIDAKQQAVYLRYADGHVQLVNALSDGPDNFDYHTLLEDLHTHEDIERETVADIEHAENVEL